LKKTYHKKELVEWLKVYVDPEFKPQYRKKKKKKKISVSIEKITVCKLWDSKRACHPINFPSTLEINSS
jgi:hypothetical protein